MKRLSKGKSPKKAGFKAWIVAVILASAVAVAVIAGGLAASRTAQAKQAGNQVQLENADDDGTVTFANQKIKIDPQTGRLRKPTLEEARAILETVASLTNRDSKGLKVERGPNRTRRLDLQNRFQTVVLAKPNPDGTNEIRCVTSQREAADFLGLDPSQIPPRGK